MTKDYFWFRLFKTRGIGPKRLGEIARVIQKEDLYPEKFPDNQRELLIQYPELSKILRGKIFEEDQKKLETDFNKLKRRGIKILYPGHPNFPQEQLEVSPILFVKGQQELLMADSIAIVGSRNISKKGIQITEDLAAGFAISGLNIVSGYAKGIDSAAHLGSLVSGGTTTLVLPCGINELRQKKDFRRFDWNRDILAVSQFDPDTRWLARNAMTRNKLVCALSKAVIVIACGPERDISGKMSGTFNTAKTAMSMGIPLFVLDPSRFDLSPRGNTDLIRSGGISFNKVEEVLSQL